MSELRLYLLAIGIVILLAIYFFGRKRREDSSHDVFADKGQDHTADALIPSRKVPSMDNPELFSKSNDSKNNPQPEARIEPKLDDWDDPTEETEALPEPVELTDRLEDHELITEEPDFDEESITASRDEAVLPPEEPVTHKVAPRTVEKKQPAAAETSPPGQIIVMYVVAKSGKTIPGAQALKAFHAHKLRFGDMDIYHRQTGSGDSKQILFSLASMLKPGTLVPNELSNRDLKGLSLFMKTEGLSDPRGAYDDMVHVAQQLAYSLDAELKDNTLAELTHEKIADQRTQLKNLA